MRVPGGVCVCVWLDVCDVAVCNPDGISEPASLGMIEDYNQMLIGQDSTSTPPASPQIGSDTDVNDVVWVFDFTSMALTRIISAPWGAATASPAWHKAIKAANLPDAHPGFNYLTTSLAHPYGENGNHPKLAAAASTGAQGYVAYLGPFPNFDKVPVMVKGKQVGGVEICEKGRDGWGGERLGCRMCMRE